MGVFPQIRGIHASDREFQFGFGEFWLLNAITSVAWVWGFSPRFEEFTLVIGNFNSDLGNFGS